MLRKFFVLLCAAAIFSCGALNVTITPGKLASVVDDDTEITALVVTGTMDARDFKFIADELNNLTSLDLSLVTITAYSNSTPMFGVITDYASQAIPRTAFFGKKLTSVKLPAGLEEIGYGAFAGCDLLTDITIPATVTTIGDYAFAGSGLTSVTLASNVVNMGKGVFARCTSLTSATIEAAPVGDFAFLGDTQLTSVVLGELVPSIGIGAFNGCTSLSEPTIASGSAITAIGDEAFIASGLTALSSISSMKLASLGDWAFAQTQLGSMSLPAGLYSVGEGLFAHDYQLKSVTLPKLGNVKRDTDKTYPSINKASRFSDDLPTNTTLPGLAFQTALSKVSDYMFASDTLLALKNLLRKGVVTIGNYAFYNNSQDVDTMKLPSTVTALGDYAMAGMTGMMTLNTGASAVPAVGQDVWAGVEQSIVPLITPSEESTELYKVADQWKEFFFGGGSLYQLGDVNCDGVVDISDVTTLIDYVLGGKVEPFCEDVADVNQDGTIDIADVTALIDRSLTQASMMSVRKVRAAIRDLYESTGDALSVDAFSMRAGETRTVEVKLNNSERTYSALQCELVLPQGVHLNGIEAADRDSDHQFKYVHHVDDESVVTLIGFSMSLADFVGNEGAIMRLSLTADEDFDGNGTVLSVENVRLCTRKSKVYLADDALAQVGVNTGVEQTVADKQVASVRYYNIQGQESETPFNGVNIVVTTYTDGTSTTAKVLR